MSIQEGSFFGEQEVLDKHVSRELFAVAEERCQLYYISGEFFCEILGEFPLVAEEVNEIMRKRKDKYKICSMLAATKLSQQPIIL